MGCFCDHGKQIKSHCENIVKECKKGIYEVCDEPCYWPCHLCRRFISAVPKRKWNGAKCIFTYHTEEFFGLARSDYLEVQGHNRIKNWKQANDAVTASNARYIPNIKADSHNLHDGSLMKIVITNRMW